MPRSQVRHPLLRSQRGAHHPLVCGDIHGQYVRARVLYIRRCKLTDGFASMTS